MWSISTISLIKIMEDVTVKIVRNFNGTSSIQQVRGSFYQQIVNICIIKKLVKSYIRGIALCGVETWILGKVDQNQLDIF
jgi:hypothetical protein